MCKFFCTSKEAAGDSEAQAQDIVFSRPDIGSFMAETVQGFEGSVSPLGVFACGPGPIYSRVAAFCRPVLLLVSFSRSRSAMVGAGLCWMWQDVPFAR